MATTFSDLVNDVLLLMEGYGLDQDRAAFLSADITDTALTFNVADATNMAEGIAEIGDELIYVQSVDYTANVVTLAPDGRGYRGTVAASHTANSRVTMAPVLPRSLVKRKINETIVGVYPQVFGVGSTLLSYDPVIIGYSLPSDVEEVLGVTFRAIGPTLEWPPVRRFRVDHHPDPTTFTTGKVLNVYEGLGPSQDLRVVYQKVPQELAGDTDLLTVSGLSSTARAAIVAGAAWRLVSFMDASRLKVNTAVTDQLDERNPIGTATQVGSYLRKQYEREVADEQMRQQLAYPPILHFQE